VARASEQERFSMIAASLPGRGGPLSIAQALAVGSVLIAENDPRNDSPQWFLDGWDVVDLLTAGMYPSLLPCTEERFTAVRDTWLDALRGGPWWSAITDMLELLVQLSHDTSQPIDDPHVVMSLIAGLVDVPSCMRPIDSTLRPQALPQVHPASDRVGTAAVREALALRPGIRVLTGGGEELAMDERAAAMMRELAAGRAEMLGRPLEPSDRIFGEEEVEGFKGYIDDLIVSFGFSPAVRHATKTTGFMPPGPRGLPNQHHQDEWEQVVEDYLGKHPDVAADFDAEVEADKAVMLHLKITMQGDAASPANRAITIRTLREEPDGDLAQFLIRLVPLLLKNFGRTALLHAAGDWTRGVEGAPTMTDLGRALLWLERSVRSGNDGYTTEEAVQAAAYAAEFYCAAAASEDLP
jgi:hypothetical protein